MKNHDVITKNVYEILQLIESAGYCARVVGGAVRNSLLRLPISDIDIATTSEPDKTIDIFKKNGIQAIPTGIDYGTVTISYNGVQYEITTLREDVKTFGRKAVVKYTKSFEQDSWRRDFTINAIYMDKNGKIWDYHKGLQDISAIPCVIKFIGDIRERIHEDYLRILRYYRFVAYYGEYNFDVNYLRIINEEKKNVSLLSSERILSELQKIFSRADSYKIILPMAPILNELFGLEYKTLEAVPWREIFANLSAQERLALLLKFSQFSLNELIKKFHFPKNIQKMLGITFNGCEMDQLKKELKILHEKNRNFFIALVAAQNCNAGQPIEKIQHLIMQLKDFCNSRYVNFEFRAYQLEKFNLRQDELQNVMIKVKNAWLNSAHDMSVDDCTLFANQLLKK